MSSQIEYLSAKAERCRKLTVF